MAALNVNMAPGVLKDSIRFGSLKFITDSTSKLWYAPSFELHHVVCFGSLEFVADQLDHPRRVPPFPREVLLVVDLNTLVRNIDAHIEPNPEPKECRCTFYVLTYVTDGRRACALGKRFMGP